MTVTEVLAAGRWWTTYTRCPHCRQTTLNSRSSSDARTAPASWPQDEERRIWCGECRRPYGVRPTDQVPTDATSRCPACAAEVPHPRAAPHARCLACALVFSAGPRPRSVYVRYRLARISFDGWTVTLTRLWAPPLWGWRSRRITLDRILQVSYYQPVFTESESRLGDRFVVHVRDRDRPVKLWMWTLYGSPYGRREHQALKMVDILRQAVWGRARLIVQDAVGLGPWTETEWAHIEQAFPEVSALHHVSPVTPYDHRGNVNRVLAIMRGDRGTAPSEALEWGARIEPHSIMGGGPYDAATLYWARANPELQREDRAWLAFLDRLRGHTDVFGRPEWQRRIDGLLNTTATDGIYAAERQS